MSDNPHASIAVDPMEQWLQRTVTSFETVKAEELKQMIFEYRHSATRATWNSTKVRSTPRLAVLKYGKKHTAQLLAGCFKTGTLK